MQFKQWMKNDLESQFKNSLFIDPDMIWDNRFSRQSLGLTFIYTIEGKLYSLKNMKTHADVIDSNSELIHNLYDHSLRKMYKKALFGRCANYNFKGTSIYVISFWNNNLQELIMPCVKKVLSIIGNIDKPIILSTPNNGNQFSKNLTTKSIGQSISDEDMQLLRQLHLMTGKEKELARKKLGLWAAQKRPDAEYRTLQPENYINFPQLI
jgi:hypothetical protein